MRPLAPGSSQIYPTHANLVKMSISGRNVQINMSKHTYLHVKTDLYTCQSAPTEKRREKESKEKIFIPVLSVLAVLRLLLPCWAI